MSERLGTAPHRTFAAVCTEAPNDDSRTPSHPAASATSSASRNFRAPGSVSEQELITALDVAGWRLSQAAEGLGVLRPSLYNLIRKYPHVRNGDTLRPAEEVAAMRAGYTELPDLAIHLRIPQEALRRRLEQLRVGGRLDEERSTARTEHLPPSNS